MLNDKVAIVTGASRGLGFEISKKFAERGAKVIMCSRSKTNLEKSASMIKGRVYPETMDVTNVHRIRDLVHHIFEMQGRIDILVNNAGYPFDRNIWTKRFHEVAEEYFDRIIDVDLKGAFRLSQAVIPFMIKDGERSIKAANEGRGYGGVIINIASTPAISGFTLGAPYSIAKAGVIAMTKHLALEYGDKNIRAYTLALGNISTEATFGSMTLTERKKAAMENSMKRWGDPAEVANIAASLATEDFAFATGNTIIIDGGTVMQ
ncbi:MAG TPA: SDR family oxidoreductase [Nitrososphaera sp.]